MLNRGAKSTLHSGETTENEQHQQYWRSTKQEGENKTRTGASQGQGCGQRNHFCDNGKNGEISLRFFDFLTREFAMTVVEHLAKSSPRASASSRRGRNSRRWNRWQVSGVWTLQLTSQRGGLLLTLVLWTRDQSIKRGSQSF